MYGRGTKPSTRSCLFGRSGTSGNFPIGPSGAYREEGRSCSGESRSLGLGGLGRYSRGGGRIFGDYVYLGRPYTSWAEGHTSYKRSVDPCDRGRVNIKRLSHY